MNIKIGNKLKALLKTFRRDSLYLSEIVQKFYEIKEVKNKKCSFVKKCEEDTSLKILSSN